MMVLSTVKIGPAWPSCALCSDVSHYRNRETLMRRKATEPHLKDSGIYRKRWWAYLTVDSTIFELCVVL